MVFSLRAYVLEVLAPCKRTHAVSGRQPLTTTPPPDTLADSAGTDPDGRSSGVELFDRIDVRRTQPVQRELDSVQASIIDG